MLCVVALIAAPSSHSLDKFTKPQRHRDRRIDDVPQAQGIKARDAQATPSVGTELNASNCAVVLEWLAKDNRCARPIAELHHQIR
jgi:hypothetical protein